MNPGFAFFDADAISCALSGRFEKPTKKAYVSIRDFLPTSGSISVSSCERLSGGSILAVIFSKEESEAIICKIPAGEMYSKATAQILASHKMPGDGIEHYRIARDVCHSAIGAH